MVEHLTQILASEEKATTNVALKFNVTQYNCLWLEKIKIL